MKFLGFILLLATAGQLSAQRSDFVEYLLSLQYATEPLHQHIMSFLAESRNTLSTELTALNDDAVHEITAALRQVIAIRDSTEAEIGELSTPENEACIADATANWAQDLTTVGDAISACSEEHVDPIYTQTEEFHLYIQDHNRLAFSVQNMVLNTFTDLNPLTDFELLSPTVEAEIDRIFAEFEEEIRVELETRLAAIAALRESVPREVFTCVHAATNRLEESANAILEAVRSC